VTFGKNTVQQRGLATAKIAGKNCNGDGIGHDGFALVGRFLNIGMIVGFSQF
jgi:hypothetical protein